MTDRVGQLYPADDGATRTRRPLDQLVTCATRVFVEQGYARTQMADVATALGVAKGTLYLYVESKEALFDLAVRWADAARPFADPPALPLPTPKPGRLCATSASASRAAACRRA